METIRLGRQLRALRHRQRLRQDDVATRSRISRSEIGRAERGQADRLRLATLDRIATTLGARLDIRVSWNGEALDRLMDADHAALVDDVVRRLRSVGWESAVEVSFNIRGERGAVDVLGFHPPTGALVVVEVKSVVPDVQATLMTLDRKARLAREIALGVGWRARSVGRLLVVGESRTSRRRIEMHTALFSAALPARTVAVRRWLADPTAVTSFRGLWFLSTGQRAPTRHRMPDPSRKQRPT